MYSFGGSFNIIPMQLFHPQAVCNRTDAEEVRDALTDPKVTQEPQPDVSERGKHDNAVPKDNPVTASQRGPRLPQACMRPTLVNIAPFRG